jgi:hypothetical protein
MKGIRPRAATGAVDVVGGDDQARADAERLGYLRDAHDYSMASESRDQV